MGSHHFSTWKNEVPWFYLNIVLNKFRKVPLANKANPQVATKSWTFEKKAAKKRGTRNRSTPEGEATALAADGDNVEELKRKFKERHEAWKFTRRSGQTTLDKNNKTWKWCTGPGHFGLGMWVAHEPSSCTNRNAGRGGRGRGNPPPGLGTETAGRGTPPTAAHARGLRTNVARDAFRAHVTSTLQDSNGNFGDDVTPLIDSIVNHMHNSSS